MYNMHFQTQLEKWWRMMYNITIFCNRSHVQAQPDSSAAFLQEYSHFCGFQFHSCRNAWIPASFLWIPVSFHWIPQDSTGMTGFLQECVGQWKVLTTTNNNDQQQQQPTMTTTMTTMDDDGSYRGFIFWCVFFYFYFHFFSLLTTL